MTISRILSQRSHCRDFFFQQVYEWENILSHELHIPTVDDVSLLNPFYRIARASMPFLNGIIKTEKPALTFAMNPKFSWGNNKKTIIPCIIDFYLREKKELAKFYKDHSRCPVVLISSREVYDFLLTNGCPLKIHHWPLSIADNWLEIDTSSKRYDLAMFGRQNKILVQYARRYAKEHPSFTYLEGLKDNGRFYAVSSDGKGSFPCDTRNEYMQALARCRHALYCTPSMDSSSQLSNGFNQVTPRFLECLACGCSILARYPDNSETEFYNLAAMSHKIESYADFCQALSSHQLTSGTRTKQLNYLKLHTTSRRAFELIKIINSL